MAGPFSADDDDFLVTREIRRGAPAVVHQLRPPPDLTPVNPNRGSIAPPSKEGGRRYEVRSELGRGGMGEVRLCTDKRIGRDVAMKVILPMHRDSEVVMARFWHEARVQAQLEHPSIVPVYDVGVDENGAGYFTMKRLRGFTLSQIFKARRNGDADVLKAYPRRRLLSAFASVCLAMDYAHSRGVIHRDLKPSNIMLGDFGEVYVIDWGLAKLIESTSEPVDVPASQRLLNVTMPGNVIGTPGYMSPEQARAKTELIGAATDIYSLGAILFEMLALESLHGGDTVEKLMSTVKGCETRPSLRAPQLEIPPELDAICEQATRLVPGERFLSARALHDAIQRFLDGDKNLELRRDLCAQHVEIAKGAIDAALSGAPFAEQARGTALSELGRALSLDPQSKEASLMLDRLFTEAPRQLPQEVAKEMEALANTRHAMNLRSAILADITGVSAASMFSIWMGLRDWLVFGLVWVFTLASMGFKYLGANNLDDERRGVRFVYLAYLCNIIAVMGLSRGFGPLFFMPLMTALFTYAYCTTHLRGYRTAVLTTGLLSVLLGVGLEFTGVLSPIYEYRDGAVIILPTVLFHTRIPTTVSLTFATLFLIAVPSVMMGRMQEMLRSAEEKNLLQAWQFKQLSPGAKRGT